MHVTFELLFLTTMFVHLKAKDTYHARCFELEKLKRENANQKDCERAEMKMKRARVFTFADFMIYNVFCT